VLSGNGPVRAMQNRDRTVAVVEALSVVDLAETGIGDLTYLLGEPEVVFRPVIRHGDDASKPLAPKCTVPAMNWRRPESEPTD